ncbi:MAG: hypothetical protein R2877_01425 [Bdellovibrionota bacterium]
MQEYGESDYNQVLETPADFRNDVKDSYELHGSFLVIAENLKEKLKHFSHETLIYKETKSCSNLDFSAGSFETGYSKLLDRTYYMAQERTCTNLKYGDTHHYSTGILTKSGECHELTSGILTYSEGVDGPDDCYPSPYQLGKVYKYKNDFLISPISELYISSEDFKNVTVEKILATQ